MTSRTIGSLIALLAGCSPDPAATDGVTGSAATSDTTGPTTTSASMTPTTNGTDAPATDDSAATTSTSSSDTGEDPTEIPPGAEVTRVLYFPVVLEPKVVSSSLRVARTVDGEPWPPETVLLAPEGVSLQGAGLPRPGDLWFTQWINAASPVRLWLIDTATLTPYEVTLPPEIERIVLTRITRDKTGLIVESAPPGVDTLDSREYWVCPIGAAGECTLQHIAPSLAPMTRVNAIGEFSSGDGAIIFSMTALEGPGVEFFLADLAALDDAVSLAAFPDAGGGFMKLAPDAQTLYLALDRYYAVDLATDPPGPPVELHQPLMGGGSNREQWNADMTKLLLWNGSGVYGQLYRLDIDGVFAGPLEPINAGAPNHSFRDVFAWSTDSTRVIFGSDYESPTNAQLYLAASDAPFDAPVRLSAPLGDGGQLIGASVLPDGEHILYFARQTEGAPIDLFWVGLGSPGEAVQLSPPQPTIYTLDPEEFDVSVDGLRILFTGEEVADQRALYLVDIVDGAPTPAVNLTAMLPPGANVETAGHLTPDGDYAVFTLRNGTSPAGLHMVPVAQAPQPALELSEPGEVVLNYRILSPP